MKNIFCFDEAGAYTVTTDLIEGGEMPEFATDVQPPEVSEGYLCRWNGADWTIEHTRSPISY